MLARLLQISDRAFATWRYLPGLAVCLTIACVSIWLAQFAGTGIIWALLFGIAVASTVVIRAEFVPGIELASKHVLRIGVALLGLQISQEALHALNLASVIWLCMSVMLILGVGWIVGPLFGIARDLSMVLAASVAICGASAAAAFAMVFLAGENSKRDVGCTIGLVSLLSMVAMLAYAPLMHAMGLSPKAAGFVLGGSIQEVVHAVAAGYSVGAEAGDMATLTKLLRVALLAPMLFLFGAAATRAQGSMSSLPLLPWFLVVFTLFALLNLSGFVAKPLEAAAASVSRFCLVVALAGIGIMLPWRSLVSYGWQPLALLILLSALLFTFTASFVVLTPFG
jgi:uncharacterized integral membrane protein (TIGR00698 family)